MLILVAFGATMIGFVWLLLRTDRGLDKASRKELRRLRTIQESDEPTGTHRTGNPSQRPF
jgi:hypothetical protein